MTRASTCFFILSLVIAVKVHAGDLVEDLTKINSQVKLGSISCDVSKSSAYGFNPFSPDQTDIYCKAIDATVHNPLSHVCTPFYKNEIPHWKDPTKSAELGSYATKDAVPKSRNEMLAGGASIGSPSESAKLIAAASKVRESMLKDCCQGDSVCEKAFHGVAIRTCVDQKADADPSAPDKCSLIRAYYQPGPERADKYKTLNLIYSKLTDQRDLESVEKTTGTTPAMAERKLQLLNSGPSDTPISGEIVLAPYVKNGSSLIPSETLRHELSHACSSIVRQRLAFAGGPLGRAAALSLSGQSRVDGACDLDPSAGNLYAQLFSAKDGKNETANCIYAFAAESNKPTSYGYIPNACESSKLEEGFAEAKALLTAPSPLVPESFPLLTCEGNPSRLHPPKAGIADCLVRYSNSFRKKLERELDCK